MPFLDDDYLLTTDLARELYHEHAKAMPIVDYHCHLHPEEIYRDPNFSGIVEAWLTDGNNYGDHYKWRLERANGVPERLITGDADPWDKFLAYAQTMEKAIGSPVYLWTHQELRRYFGIDEELNSRTARAIFDQTNAMLAMPEFSRRNLLRRMNVDTICTTDDPVDSLEYHIAFEREGGDSFVMLPAMRPDKALNPQADGFADWLGKLEDVTGMSVESFDDLLAALDNRVEFFSAHGGKLSDHAADLMTYRPSTTAQRDAILEKARRGEELDADELCQYRTALLLGLMRIYRKHDWTMQLHIHALRNINEHEFAEHGPDTGFDSINDRSIAEPFAALLNEAAKTDSIPKMLVYSLNPNDYLALTTIMGCFQGGMKQKLSLGNAWWFNDTRRGIRQQIETLAEGSLLGNFVGMTTDSRSFLSFPRHDFFRRILCELLGEWASRGEIPGDAERLAPLVCDISYHNAKELFI
ncbi:glucuronate isomerase [Bifidobacterium choloepi]|uniref:Uronate isomerase n=1 Tax=Bifidobacterium choloepi TaxID=2614131 RepID=A0A6I5MY13_9BIFI|nr:glucuronate isomerase [Bifidobacterium choloepi]NEG69488.1 glucuronate isomerase [Bifidobacterium choloepi]